MNKLEIVLTSLTPSGSQLLRPVQVQKLLFLIDREIGTGIGGPFFDFRPYNYGPFDVAVYDELRTLAKQGLVTIVPEYTWQDYGLSEQGQVEGEKLLRTLPVNTREYIVSVSKFVREQSFKSLVLAIYKAYPEMRQNSIFREQ